MARALYGVFLVMYFTLASSAIQSLQLRMIHRDSIYSPLYPGNLTAEEHMDRLYNYTTLRAKMIESRMSSAALDYNTTRVQPRVEFVPTLYVLELVIGTPRHAREHRKARYLMMDTSSGLVWLQCQPCIHCWSPPAVVFDPRSSQSFAPVPCNHPLCDLRIPHQFQCINHQCHYTYMYGHPSLTRGVLATETFGFASDRGGFEFVHNFAFGCSHDSQNFNTLGSVVSGIAGFNRKRTSFLSQMNQGQANDIHSEIDYFVSLIDVSVENRRVGFPPGTFRVRIEHGVLKGGFFIDSGSAYSSFNTGGPYERVKNTFEEYFHRFRLAHCHQHGFEVCYKIPRGGFNAYPSMTFHFQNGNDFMAPPENVVVIDQRCFCVMIGKSQTVNTLGAYQQRNYQMSFDIQSRTISYAPADCTRDA
ncbi:aspartic proteinase nepenthesin-2-like [Ananas comosus]|uniref:Aspartic proteinase nepenthesin-2-like n=1 Tax=Ananas comosus TaxID=4615 RepID=A0A6P5GZH8_ANACO|nr:aspartic proteinase nepenthesin-2-like [Ananas comosus]